MAVKIHERSDGSYRVTIRREPTTIADKLREMRWSDRWDASKQAATDLGRSAADTMISVSREAIPAAKHARSYFSDGPLSFSSSPMGVDVTSQSLTAVNQPRTWTEAFSQAKFKAQRNPVATIFKTLGLGAAAFLAAQSLGATLSTSVSSFMDEGEASAESVSPEEVTPTRPVTVAQPGSESQDTRYTRTFNANTSAENDMRVRIENAVRTYTEDFVGNARSGHLSNMQKCINFQNTEYVAGVRAQPIQVQTPKRLRIAIIDPGHAREAAMGAHGYDTGAYAEVEQGGETHVYEEAMITGRLGTELASQLEEEGVIVINVRDETRNGLSLSGLDTRLSLAWRSGIATRLAQRFPEAEIVYINIHADSLGEDARNQTVFAYAPERGGVSDSANSVALASALASRYRLSPFSEFAEQDTKSIAALRCNAAAVPAVLIETGNLQNAYDQVQFSKVIYGNDEKTGELAGMMRDGIMAYFHDTVPHLDEDHTYSMTVRARTGLPRDSLQYHEADGPSVG